jgi:hypothetical protein
VRTHTYERTCKGCGNEFVATNVRKIRCRKDCGVANRARTRTLLDHEFCFVGVDGEGVDRPDGVHEYVMLSVGDQTLWKDGRALTLGEILSFLWQQYTERPDAAYVGFFLGYDFIQWEKLLPEHAAYLLLTSKGIAERKSSVKSRANPFPDAVVWEGWEIDIMAGRRFKLRPHTHHRSDYTGLCRNRTCAISLDGELESLDDVGPIQHGEMDWIPSEGPDLPWQGWDYALPGNHTVGQGHEKVKAAGWMYICDTGPFWQTSFLNVIKPSNWGEHPVCTEEEYATVVRGKADRGTVADYGTSDYFGDMQRYNVLENDILARVTARLNKGFMNDAIPIRIARNEWYGPGRAAQLWMDMLHGLVADDSAIEANKRNGNRYRVNDPNRVNEGGILNADVYDSMPSWYYEAAQASYYGGWFEQFVHGHVGNVWEYDINSAYPHIIASLPCLHTGTGHNGAYTKGEDSNYPRDPSRYVLLYGTFRGTNPYIGCLPYRTSQGNILRPQITKGWYWAHEVEASARADLLDSMEVEQWVAYRKCDCSPPFNPDDIGIGRMYNLRLAAGKNTPEGKAFKLVYNSAYGKTAQSIGSPKYSNPFYASLITAGCRTLILEAIASHPQKAAAVTMVATDGVYFIGRHEGLHLSPTELGAWDETFKAGMTQLMPGVYWDDNTRESIGLGGVPKLKSRGVNAKDLAKEIQYLDGMFAQSHLDLSQGKEYTWPTMEFKVNFLLTSAKSALQRGKWDDAGRVEHGTTRSISANPITKRDPIPYRDEDFGGITRTRPYAMATGTESEPYSKAFGYAEWNDDSESVDRDGRDGLSYFRDLINGA